MARPAKDRSALIGQQFGLLTVIGVAPTAKKANWKLLCRCACGTEQVMQGYFIVSGQRRACKKCQWKHVHEAKIGERYGKWIVIRHGGMKRRTSGYVCQCECGSQHWVSNSNLVRGSSVGCVKCEMGKRRSRRHGDWWSSMLYGAVSRDLVVEVTKDHLLELFKSQGGKCALSGQTLRLYTERGSCGSVVRRTASVDRIDSKKGYVVGNVQWVHVRINIMKGAMDEDYFLRLCRMVAKTRRPNCGQLSFPF